MSFDLEQFRDFIVRPALVAIGLCSDNAVQLILGTCAVESNFGKYLVQKSGPAISCYQIEPNTYHYIWDNYVEPNVGMRAKIRLYLGYTFKPDPKRMASDLALATIMCRLYYYSIRKPLPDKDDVRSMAEYWKTFYNTAKGKGTPEKFIQCYDEYITASV